MVRRKRHRAGFSLVEAIAAMTVIAIVAPTSLIYLHDASRARIDAANATRAAWLAQTILEEGAADAASSNPAVGFDAMANEIAYERAIRTRLEQTFGDPDGVFGIAWTLSIDPVVVAPVPGGHRAEVRPGLADPEFRRIEVTVRWTNSLGRDQTLMAQSVVVKP